MTKFILHRVLRTSFALATVAMWLAPCSDAFAGEPVGDPDWVAPDDAEANWHQWRGPYGNGRAADNAKPPLKWSAESGVKWIASLPGNGSATPVVWQDQLFALSAEETNRKADAPPSAAADAKTSPPGTFHRFHVTCVDRSTGRIIWDDVASEEVPHEGHHPTHTYAGGSPLTDGERLYASFGSRGIFCYTLDGKRLWSKDLGDMRTRFGWGEAVTPALAGELLIVNWDQEEDSFVCALDVHTGDEVWRVARPDEKTSWNTPFITRFQDRTLAIINGSGKARAYDAANGSVMWECGGQTTNAIPSPVRFEDFVVCMSGYRGAAAVAIPLNATGDVTGAPSLLWSHGNGTPYVPSPALSGHRLYFTGGNSDVLTCLDVRTGQPLIDRQRLSGAGDLYASPLAAGGHVYFVGRQGTTVVLRDDESSEVVASNTIADQFDASPVAVGDQLFLRSWTKLYCISSP